MIVSNQINQIESSRKHRCCTWVWKEFVATDAWTHCPGHGSVYQCSDLSVIPLIYPGTPPYLVLKCFVHYLLRSFKQKILMEKYWIGLTLFGPENVAIIRVRFIILTTATFWSIYIVFYLQANPLNMAFFHGEKATSFIDLMKENKYILLHLVVPISTMVINIALVIYLAVVQHKIENSVQIFVIFGNKNQTVLNQEEKFSFSVSSMVGFPSLLLFTIIASLPNRSDRLMFYCPMQIFVLTTVLPLYIILTNHKVKHRADKLYLDFFDMLGKCKSCFLKRTSTQISPAQIQASNQDNPSLDQGHQ